MLDIEALQLVFCLVFVFPCYHNSTIRAIKSGFGSNGKITPQQGWTG